MSKKGKIVIGVCAALLAAAALTTAAFIIRAVRREQKKKELRQAYETFYNEHVERFARENESVSGVDAVFLGDSLTEGYDLGRYFPEYKVLNRGIAGDTTLGLEKRLKVSAYDVRPRAVAVLIGANNFDTMAENYEAIVTGLKENLPEAKIILLSLTAMDGEWARRNPDAIRNNEFIKELAAKHGCAYVDLFTPLLDESTGRAREGYTIDGGHLTAEGYAVVTNAILPALKTALGEGE